jgi:hypothetical protein
MGARETYWKLQKSWDNKAAQRTADSRQQPLLDTSQAAHKQVSNVRD